jgi:hypothetical protein
LEDNADSRTQERGTVCGVDAGHLDAAGVRLPQSDDALDERRLAGAIGAEQAEDLPPVDAQRDAAYGFDGAVRLD